MRRLLIGTACMALLSATFLVGAPVHAGGDEPPPIWPIALAATAYTCDAEGDVAPGTEPWPTETLIVIPMCVAGPGGIGWIDWTPPTGGTAELIDAVSAPAFIQPVDPWEYATATGAVSSGNLEAALDARAGLEHRLLMADAWCGSQPDGDVCEEPPGASVWVHWSSLATFTLSSAHLSGDLSACGPAQNQGCLIGTFAGPSSPFIDIAGNLFEEDIEWAWREGITAGCAANLYCPSAAVTREQMAKFIANAFDLPPTDVDAFTDDDDLVHEDAINRIAAAGITSGCGADRFCPRGTVTREQMASFLSRAAELAPSAVDAFTDDDGRTHEADINRLAAAGITQGCGAQRYCPTQLVRRDQMAAFLHRTVLFLEAP
jgi:hypothetical protein